MKRPIFIITLGFIVGIIGGLYFNIVPFIIIIITLLLCFKIVNIQTNFKFIDIIKIFIINNTIPIIIISSLIGVIYINFYNDKYTKVYNNFTTGEIIGTIVSDVKESDYRNSYKIKLESFNNKKCNNIYCILQINKKKCINLKYGNKIKFKGEYILPEISRNYGGFNYREYLKTQKVYGIFKTENITIETENNLNKLEIYSNNIKHKIIDNIKKILPEETRELFLGILIGSDDNLQDNIKVSFEKSNLTHLLAVSGAHIAYIIAGLTYVFKKLNIIKSIQKIFISLFLIFFMYVTEFSASVVRATIMGITVVLPALIHRKQDTLTTITFSLLVILICNPYKILDIGLILSYLATIGIILFSKMSNKNEIKTIQDKLINEIKELLLITIFANIFVLPIMIYNFNTISLTFLISNLIAGILIGPITIGGFVLILISFINIKVTYIIGIPYNLLLKLLIISTSLVSKIPFSQIFIPTPDIFWVIIYYFLLTLIFSYIILKRKCSNRYIFNVLHNWIIKIKHYIKKYIVLILILIIFILITIFIVKIVPDNLKIYFIDVGQGDSTLIITPVNKKLIIDSGGSESGKFDVGENTLVPYLLDRGITCLDYICISHFDADHCQGFEYLLENIRVKNIIISKQYEVTDNFNKIMNIVDKRNINILKVEAGNVIKLDKYVKLKVLHPGSKLSSNINDNSIVIKLEYSHFSCLFTGDISKEVENSLINKYGNYLKTDILKVAHHGSKTSSSEEFLKKVKPQIALIGVGENNKFGHPNNSVIERLNKINCKVYRTDLMGEISLEINRRGKKKINTYIK